MTTEIDCQEFHELAMDYRGASFAHVPQAYEALCKYIESRLAASGGNAAPELTDERIEEIWHACCGPSQYVRASGYKKFARAIEAASAPNAALVAALKQCLISFDNIEVPEGGLNGYDSVLHAESVARAALSATGQEVKS